MSYPLLYEALRRFARAAPGCALRFTIRSPIEQLAAVAAVEAVDPGTGSAVVAWAGIEDPAVDDPLACALARAVDQLVALRGHEPALAALSPQVEIDQESIDESTPPVPGIPSPPVPVLRVEGSAAAQTHAAPQVSPILDQGTIEARMLELLERQDPEAQAELGRLDGLLRAMSPPSAAPVPLLGDPARCGELVDGHACGRLVEAGFVPDEDGMRPASPAEFAAHLVGQYGKALCPDHLSGGPPVRSA